MSIFGQVAGYGDLGVLVSQNSKQGTARSMAMKDAFGALGGDLSALSINPAGSAVYSTSSGGITLGYNELETDVAFYTGKTNQLTENFAISQIGGVLVFDNDTENANVKKFVLGVNYAKTNDFKNSWTATGGTVPTWVKNYFNSIDTHYYNQLTDQSYKNKRTGKQTELNINVSADINNNLYLGASLNSHNFEFNEDAERRETVKASDNSYVDAFEHFWVESKGEGISVGLGLIYKPVHALRLGLAYTSPVWYNITEYNNLYAEDNDVPGYYNVYYSFDPPSYTNNSSKTQTYEYQMRTPSKLTASAALVFAKNGLLSADFTRKNYSKIHLSPEADFIDSNGIDQNKTIATNLQESYSLNLGTEWRFDQLSIRGGYSYEQTPYKYNIDTDNRQGYAFGLGYNFGHFAIDVAYNYHKNTDVFNFYTDVVNPHVNAAELNYNNHQVNATLSAKF